MNKLGVAASALDIFTRLGGYYEKEFESKEMK